MKKKVVALMLVGVMAVALTACGSSSSDSGSAAAEETTEEAAEEATEEAAEETTEEAAEETTEEATEEAAEETTEEAADDTAASGDLIKIGVTFGDLENTIWADCANTMMEIDEDYGFDVNVVGCSTSEEQITQIENFLTNGCEGLVIGAKDSDSMSAYMEDVVDDTVVFAFGYAFENFTAEMMVMNYEVGYACASQAADWINENYPDGCKVLINDYPDMDILVERVQGMTDALAEKAPQAEVVANVSGTTTAEILPGVESAFTANPDIKCCICIGDGGGMACVEAAGGMNMNGDDFGIFSVDLPQVVAQAVKDGDIKGAICLGSGAQHAEIILGILQQIFNGEDYEVSTPYPMIETDASNVEEIAASLGYTLE